MMLASAAFAVGSICVERAARPQNGSWSFDWNDVVIGDDATCGVFKCYLASKTGATGYLVSRRDLNKASHTHSAGDAWSFASCLRQRYGLKHFYLAPQRKVRVSKEVAARLTSMHVTRNSSAPGAYHSSAGTTAHAFQLTGHHVLVVQKVRAAPARAFTIGCSHRKRPFAAAALPDFWGAVRDKAAFGRRLNASLQASLAAMSHEPCLLGDFHAFVTQEGHIIHMDLDRCYDALTFRRNGTLSTHSRRTDDWLKAELEGQVRWCLLGLWAWLTTGEASSLNDTTPVRLLHPFLRAPPTTEQQEHPVVRVA